MTDVTTAQLHIDGGEMREEVIVFCVMAGVVLIGSVITKNRREWSVAFLLLASLLGSLVSGMGIRVREIVEGPFGFLDASLSIASATLFVFLFYKAGGFKLIYDRVARVKNRVLKAFLTLFFIAFPSSLTGFPLASVMTTGVIVSESMKKSGVKKSKITEVVAIGSVIGAIMPPNSIPAIIASNGAGSVLPTPYNGFYAPLLAISLPVFIIYSLLNMKALSVGEEEGEGKCGVYLLLALMVLLTSLFDGLCGSICYIGGNTLYFFIGSVLVLVINKGFGSVKGCIKATADSLMEAVVPVAFLFALGAFIEVSSMTGVRGFYSLRILPYDTKLVIVMMMALSAVIGIFFSDALPAFLITYAVFPIGWLCSPVVVTGVSMALSIIPLISMRSSIFEETSFLIESDEVKGKDRIKAIAIILVILIALGLVFVYFGDTALSFLNF